MRPGPKMSDLVWHCFRVNFTRPLRIRSSKGHEPWGVLILWAWMTLGTAGAQDAKTYHMTDGRVLKGVAVREDTGSLTIQVTSDSRGEVPAGEKILVFRRDLKEVR